MKKKGFCILVAFVALSILGLALLPMLTVRLTPSDTRPTIDVSFSWNGAGVRAIEEEVTSKLEGTLATIEGAKSVWSRSNNDGGIVTLYFSSKEDIEMTRLRVTATLRQIWPNLPKGVSYPSVSIRKITDESDSPMVSFTLNGKSQLTDIHSFAEEVVGPAFGNIEGVAKVRISDIPKPEWQYEYDLDQLNVLGIGVEEIGKSLSDNHNGDLYVTSKSGNPVEVSRLVRGSLKDSRPLSYYRINGLNTICISIYANREANQLTLDDRIMEKATVLRGKLPKEYSLKIAYDTTDSIRTQLSSILWRSSLTLLILFLFIFLSTFKWRFVLLVAISLIVNLAVALILYYLFKIEIHIYSLAAITISLNLIIDSVIVVSDHLRCGNHSSVMPPLIAATLTSAGALSVIFFIEEEARIKLADFASVVMINLLVSIAVAYLMVPALMSGLGISSKKRNNAGVVHRKIREKFCHRFCIWLLDKYNLWLRFSSRPLWRISILILLAGVFGISVFIFATKVYEGGYFGKGERGIELNVYGSLPNGSTLEQMNHLTMKMESYISRFPEIAQFETSIPDARHCSITIRFTPEAEHSGFPYKFNGLLISKALTLGGGAWNIFGLDNQGFSNELSETAGRLRILMQGYNYDRLMSEGRRLADSLNTIKRIRQVTLGPEFSWWKDEYTEIKLKLDRNNMALRGVTLAEVCQTLSELIGREVPISVANKDAIEIPIKLSSVQSHEFDMWKLINLPIIVDGKSIKLSDIGEVIRVESPQSIVKDNQRYQLCLQCDYIGSPKQGVKVIKQVLNDFTMTLPQGYEAIYDEWRREDEVPTSYWLVLVVVAIVFVITAILFNSLLYPFAIILIIPVSFIGVFLSFWLFGLKYDQGAFASLVLLAGLTVNAAIYIVHEMKVSNESFAYAVGKKIFPIMLTVVSTVLGFIPFLVGPKEPFWFSLAVGTIGGLLFSIPAILFILPLMLPTSYSKN